MKRISTLICILITALSIIELSGCKTSSRMQCPDFTGGKKTHLPMLALGHPRTSKSSNSIAQTAPPPIATQATAFLASDQDMHFKLKMPNVLTQQLQSDQELTDMNKVLADYSNNKVALQRNHSGNLILKAHSIKDIFALAKKTSHPRGYYERRYGNGGNGGDAAGAAIASGVMGPISFVFAFLPILSFLAIPISIAAIITGAIGLRSHKHRLAALGLTFGILGLIISLLMSWFYIAAFGIFLLL